MDWVPTTITELLLFNLKLQGGYFLFRFAGVLMVALGKSMHDQTRFIPVAVTTAMPLANDVDMFVSKGLSFLWIIFYFVFLFGKKATTTSSTST